MDENTYNSYLSSLLKGNRSDCGKMVNKLLGVGMPVKKLYQQLFQRSLYRVGELWEFNRISVAVEHLATSVTEGLMNQMYSDIISSGRSGKKAIISSVENELHQVGGKMVADIFEMHGWDCLYLGANTPVYDLIRFIHETEPDLVGLSLTVYFHLGILKKTIEAIRKEFKELKIIIGGQAFRYGGESVAKQYDGVTYLSSLDDLEIMILANLTGGKS